MALSRCLESSPVRRTVYFAAVASVVFCHPLPAQRNAHEAPSPADTTIVIQNLPPAVCPVDRRDGPLHEGVGTYYGITARQIVDAFLAPPHDSFGRVQSGTQNVSAATLRILTDVSDYSACVRLNSILTGGQYSTSPPVPFVYFTAGGFYFVSQWKPAQGLKNRSTFYVHVMVFDAGFNLLGTYAF